MDTRNEPLAGATFLLEGSEDGDLWYPVVFDSTGVCSLAARSEDGIQKASQSTGADGILVWENLSTKYQYRITETKAPDGFTLLKDCAFEGSLPADSPELELRVVNGESFALPRTGSAELMRLPIAAVLCLALCLATLWQLRKKEQ